MSKKQSKIEIPEFIKSQFGTDDINSIIESKAKGNHAKETVLKAPSSVDMSADECKKLCKSIGVEYREGYENRVLKYICSDESVDRGGDIIRQAGWDLENFRKNPVVMAFHDYGELPVGNALKVWVDKESKQLKMHVLFPDKEVNEKADSIFKMAKSGFMKAGSVGFIPKTISDLSPEKKQELGMGPWGVEFIEQELLEHTVCGVPANANAVQEMVSKGIISKSELTPLIKKEILNNIIDEPEVEEKAGAVLSKKNKSLINKCLTVLDEATGSLKKLLNEADKEEDSSVEPDNSKKTIEELSHILSLKSDIPDDNSEEQTDEEEEEAGLYDDVKSLLSFK